MGIGSKGYTNNNIEFYKYLGFENKDVVIFLATDSDDVVKRAKAKYLLYTYINNNYNKNNTIAKQTLQQKQHNYYKTTATSKQ